MDQKLTMSLSLNVLKLRSNKKYQQLLYQQWHQNLILHVNLLISHSFTLQINTSSPYHTITFFTKLTQT